jgi:alkylated DNA repair dioxygenase AlkB
VPLFLTHRLLSPNPELKRRTQQYGHLFSYQYRYFTVSSNAGISSKKRNCYLRDGWWTQFKSRRKVLGELGPLPDFVTTILARIVDQGLSSPPNHLLVNEYEPGQGIMPHTGMASLVSSYLTLILYTNLALKMLPVYLAPLLCRYHYFRLAS